jgi:O-antigen ligase
MNINFSLEKIKSDIRGSIRNYNEQTPNRIPVDKHTPSSHRLRYILISLAKYSFFATLLLLPWRWRLVLSARPNGTLYTDYTDFLLFLPDMTLMITLLAWGLTKWIDRARLQPGPTYIWLPLAGLTIAGLFSVVASMDRALSLYHFIRLSALFLLFLYIVSEQISIMVIGIAVGAQGMLQAMTAIAQSVVQRSVGLQFLGEHALDPLQAGISVVSDGSTRFLRAYGLTDHPNILGGCLAFGLIVLLMVFLHNETKHGWIFAIPFALMSLALLLTFSRAAWLAFLAGAGLVAVMEARARRGRNVGKVVWLALETALVLLPFIFVNMKYLGVRLNFGNSFENIPFENQSINERPILNESANQIFVKHLLTGVGLGASPIAMREEFPDFPTYYQPPHFTLLVAALETGIFGGLFYFLLMTLPWVVLLRRRNSWTDPGVIGAAGLLLSVTVVGFFDYYTWLSTAGRGWQWLAWGLFASAMKPVTPTRESLEGGQA